MTRPVLEAEITPGMDPAGVVALARECEKAGFDRVGISDVLLWPDSFMLQALVATRTERVEIGAMVTNPYSRHPAVLAGALATLDEISEMLLAHVIQLLCPDFRRDAQKNPGHLPVNVHRQIH